MGTKSYQPPGWVFSVVWSILYILIGFSFALSIQSKQIPSIVMYSVLIVLLLSWPFLYFSLKSKILGIVGLVAILMVVLGLLIYLGIQKSWVEFGCLVPLFLWGCFAMSLI